MTTLPSAESFSIVSVEDRAWTRRVRELDMWSDDREIPTNLPDTYNQWWGAIYMRQSPQPSGAPPAEVSARVALAVGDERLIADHLALRSPRARDLVLGRADRHRHGRSPRTTSADRPARRINITVPGWSLVFATIARHDGSREWRGQELSLLRALGGPTAWRTRWSVIRRMYGRRQRRS